MSDQSAQEALAQEKAELAALAGKPLGSKLGTYLKKCGPGYLQSAITLGGGSLSSSLFLGVLAGFSMMWLQPLAMIMGVIMLCAISYVTLSTEKRPFRLINNHISPVLGWGWLIATLLANFVWCLPQYALGAAAIQESMFPDLRTSTTATVVICVCLLAVATTVIAFYDSGNKGIRIFEIVLKGMVALIVLCFFGVVGALAFSDQGLPIGKILSGLVPRFGLLNSPAPEYLPIIEQTGAFGAFWTAKIVDQQRDVMIAAFATAVGINMTFLLPYSMLKKGWGKEHRGLAIFDLSTSLFLPFVLATGCVVIASASQFHATDKIPSPPSKDFVKNVDARLAEEHAGFGALPDAEKQALRDALPLADQQMALAMVKRDAWSLSKALEPLAGSVASKWIFGIGVLGMALSTIIILMLISGFTICEMFNIPPRGIAHFLGCFVTGVIGAFGPFVWSGEAKPYLAIPTSVFGAVLLPIAYFTFLLLMNSKSALGEHRPEGARRLRWNVLMVVAAGIAGFGSIWGLLGQSTVFIPGIPFSVKTIGLTLLGVLVVGTIIDMAINGKARRARAKAGLSD